MGKEMRAKRDRYERRLDAVRWQINQLQAMTANDKEKLPCCFEFKALHAGIPGYPLVCPPAGLSDRLTALQVEMI